MFGLIPAIPLVLGILAVIWLVYEEYSYITKPYNDVCVTDVILNAIGNIFFIGLIWLGCILAIALVNYMYNTLHTNVIITTKYETESCFDLTDSNIASGKYVIYDSDSNKYCYYTISFNETIKNIKTGEEIVVLPVLNDNSSNPQFICQKNERKGYYPNTSPFTKKDIISEDFNDSRVDILIVPVEGILYGPIPDS